MVRINARSITTLSICVLLTFLLYFIEEGSFGTSQKMSVLRRMRRSVEHFEAAMVLSGVGDALGYKCGEWEFCHSGEVIHEELKKLGGLENIKIKGKSWIVSDDTVMHLATAEAIMEYEKKKKGKEEDKELLYAKIAQHYKDCMHDMRDRAPGTTCSSSTYRLKPDRPKGYQISFDERGGGCGAAMRAMCIGLRYPSLEQLQDLVGVSVESGRMTHHHPTGYLGALAAALFTSYALQGKPPREWGAGLMTTLTDAKSYIKSSGHEVKSNLEHWNYFETKWKNYLQERGISDGKSDPIFPEVYGVKERDAYYKSLSWGGWGGSSGHDAPMIAYDAFLGAGKDWNSLCSRSMFHSGDSDSTGVMAGCWYGAMFGFDGVPEKNYKGLEYEDRLRKVGSFFYKFYEKAGNNHEESQDCPSQSLSDGGCVDHSTQSLTLEEKDSQGTIEDDGSQKTNDELQTTEKIEEMKR